MDHEPLIDDIVRLLPEGDRVRGVTIEPCGGGGNNRVYVVHAGDRELIAKSYFRHPSDPRDRLGAEYAFLSYAHAAGIDCVPAPLASDAAHGLALYERLPGRPMQAQDVEADAVDQAVAFLRALNHPQRRALARELGPASEAAFSVDEHLVRVGERVGRLDGIAVATAADERAAAFAERLRRRWQDVRDAVLGRLAEWGEGAAEPVPERWVSPSDFGFHNALRGTDGRIRFLDFEYAGWDDPAKTVGDFFCQPAVPVPLAHFDRFLDGALADSVHASALARRARLLLPVFQIKWCCIVLNVFLPDAARRRRFADPGADLEDRKHAQCAKAEQLLASIP